MRILVTGGAGFIGSNVVDAYLEGGHEVLVVDNYSTGRPSNVGEGADKREFDIRDRALERIFQDFKPEVVNHHAAQASVPISMDDPVHDATINVLGTLNLLRASVRNGVRKFIFISTGGAIYGDPDRIPCPEDTPERPLSPYGAAKAAAEVYVGMFGRTFDLDYTILRYGNVYGPRMHFRAQEGLLVAIFATRMLRGEPVTIDWTGEQTRDFIYVGDCAAANVAALERGSRGVYNIGTGRESSVNDIFEALDRIIGYGQQPRHGPKREGDVHRIVLDTTRAQKELGWQAATDLETGLKLTVDYFRGMETSS